MRTVLGPAFFNRPTLVVAKALLGKYLVRTIGGKEIALMITETESYDGVNDLASHASRGRTARTEVLFGPAGVWYVYCIYGLHEMLNVVTKKDGAAVLLRGVQGFDGPAKLTKFLKIDRTFNMQPAAKVSGLWIEDRGVRVRPNDIEKGPRVGVDYAGPWAHKPWRFVLKKERAGVRDVRSRESA